MYRPLDSRRAQREALPSVVGSRVKFTTDWWWSLHTPARTFDYPARLLPAGLAERGAGAIEVE